jgi:RNA polymerase sigma-70 factor (ECF subfamily)
VERVRVAGVDADRRDELERLYRDQRGRMWQAVFAFAGDREVASDAVAEAFAQALKRGEAIRSPERWLWRTIFRIAAGELKQRGRHVAAGVESAYEMDDLARDLVVALGKLSPKQRGAVVLHHAVGFSAKEIASIIGSTTPAVHVHLTRARKRLRELLESDDA